MLKLNFKLVAGEEEERGSNKYYRNVGAVDPTCHLSRTADPALFMRNILLSELQCNFKASTTECPKAVRICPHYQLEVKCRQNVRFIILKLYFYAFLPE